ncbi:MAG: NTP transferase domain-containing protein [Syntrophales bacterium]|nr:NTP transferase domain-containing protein [Syntrophales bacterium]
MRKRRLCAIILAAGKGTRMKSDLAKVLHPVCGKPMLAYPVAAAREAGAEKIVVIVGQQGPLVREAFKDEGLIFVEQREQLGTGHAVLLARESFRDDDATILILCGDVPLLRGSTARALFECHVSEKATVTVLTALYDNSSGYGRVVKGDRGEVQRIVEERDATEAEKKIREINSGIYCVESKFLFEAVAEIGRENTQGEYYLTDIVEIACLKGFPVRSFCITDPDEVMGINTPDDLKKADQVKIGN